MGIMVYYLLWVVQDLHHQPYGLDPRPTAEGSGFRAMNEPPLPTSVGA